MVYAVDVRSRLRHLAHDLGVRVDEGLSDAELLSWTRKVLDNLERDYSHHLRYNRGVLS